MSVNENQTFRRKVLQEFSELWELKTGKVPSKKDLLPESTNVKPNGGLMWLVWEVFIFFIFSSETDDELTILYEKYNPKSRLRDTDHSRTVLFFFCAFRHGYQIADSAGKKTKGEDRIYWAVAMAGANLERILQKDNELWDVPSWYAWLVQAVVVLFFFFQDTCDDSFLKIVAFLILGIAFGYKVYLQRTRFQLFVWCQFVIWIRLGSLAGSKAQRNEATRAPIVHRSKLLTLEEFRAGTPYENVSEKDDGKNPPCCIFISHRWAAPDHPDRDGLEKAMILPSLERAQAFLEFILDPSINNSHKIGFSMLEGENENKIGMLLGSVDLMLATYALTNLQRQIYVWYDFYSIPQGPGNSSKETRNLCLKEIDDICGTMPVLALPTQDYFTRGWCFFECLQALIGDNSFVHLIDHESAFREKSFFRETKAAAAAPREFQMLSQVFNVAVSFRVQMIHGDFCARMELDEEKPHTILHLLGLKCTNGSDLDFLSNRLEEQSKAGDRYKPMSYYVHPFRTAFWMMFRELVAKGEELHPGRRAFLFYCLTRLTRCLTQVTSGNVDRTVRAAVRFRFRHPDSALNYLIDVRMDWGDHIPNYENNVHKLHKLLQSLADASADVPHHEKLEDHSQKSKWASKAMDNAINAIPLYGINVEFEME